MKKVLIASIGLNALTAAFGIRACRLYSELYYERAARLSTPVPDPIRPHLRDYA